MTKPESHLAMGMIGNHIRSRQFVVWVALISLAIAIVGVALVWPRTRVNPQGLWDEAQNALRSGDVATAEARLVSIGRLRAPTDVDWCLRSQIAVAKGRLEDALSALGHIPQDDVLAGEAFLMAGRIERQRNRTRAAEANFRKALACNPGLIEARKELIYILGMQLRRREVDAEFKALANLIPLNHQELYTWGLTHFHFLFNVWAEDTEEHLESFIVSDPSDRYSRLALATLLLKSTGAEARLKQVLETLANSDPEAAALLIESSFEHGRFEEAIAMLQDTPADHLKLARIRGRVSLMRGDVAAAIRYFQDALIEEPYNRVILSELGRALTLKGDQSAQRILAQAKHLDDVYDLFNGARRPDRESQAADLTQFGRACESAGLLSEARGWFLLAIDRDPLDAEAQQALQRLRDVRVAQAKTRQSSHQSKESGEDE
jgi:tetratricopeptide (TPR) repeat protein